MKNVFYWFSIFAGVFFFFPGAYEFTYRVKYYLFPLIATLFFWHSVLRGFGIKKHQIIGAVFLLLSIIFLPFSYSISRTVEGIVWLFFAVVFSVALSSSEMSEREKIAAFVFVALAIACGGIVQKVLSMFNVVPLPRDAYGVPMVNFAIGHRNPFSHFLATSIPLCFAYFPHYAPLFSLPLLLAIFISGSRAGIFASLFAFLISLFLWEKVSLRKRVFLLLLFIFATFVSHPFHKAVKKTADFSYSPNKVRLQIWKDVIHIKSPRAIVGWGLSSFPSALPFYWSDDTALLISSKHQDQYVEHAHNEFLTIFAENGILGLSLFFLIIVGSLKSGLQNWKRKKYYVVLLFTVLLISLVDSPLRNPAVFLLFLLGLDSLEREYVYLKSKRWIPIPIFLLSIVSLLSFMGKVYTTKWYFDFLSGKISVRRCALKVEKSMNFSPLFHKGYYYLGNLKSLGGEPVEAEKYFRRSLNLFKGYFTASFNLALLYLKMGKLERFQDYISYTLKLSPYYLKANEIMYFYKMKVGDKKGAQEFLERMNKVKR